MWRKTLSAFLLSAFAFMSACSGSVEPPSGGYEIRSTDIAIKSRGVAVPATFVTPVSADGEKFPLVVMAHGHGGSREEAGGFTRVAESLAHHGVASIRMDFPGCGESSESFTENNLSNMLLDLQASREFAGSQPAVDNDRVGLFGYSMGGRLVALLSEIDPSYKVMAAWAPAVEAGAARERKEMRSLGGVGYYDALRKQAEATGATEYTTRWGTKLQLGYRWFTDLEETRPLEALARFEGPLLVIYGDRDDVVPPEVSEAAIAAAKNSSEVIGHVVAGAEHGLGFYTHRPEIAAEVVDTTVEFFHTHL
jgi:dienelactone hydrolase